MLLCSLNHSPGLRKEIILLGDLISHYENIDIYYYTSKKYDIQNQASLFKIFSMQEVIFYNSSFRHLPILILRYILRKKNINVLHEPYKPNKFRYNLRAAFTVSLKEFAVRIMSYFAHELILVSPYGYELANKKFPKKKLTKLSLYRKRNFSKKPRKKKIIFVGHINSTKAPDKFTKLSKLEKLKEYEFELVTSSSCDKLNLPQNVQICYNENLSDEVISEKLNESAFVIIEHLNITQSGVLADAISHGCMVIFFGQEGINQYQRDGVTINIQHVMDSDLRQLFDRFFQMRHHSDVYFEQLYEENFSEEAFATDWKKRCQYVT